MGGDGSGPGDHSIAGSVGVVITAMPWLLSLEDGDGNRLEGESGMRYDRLGVAESSI